MDMTQEKLLVAEAMKAHGGSFVKCLGEALLHANPINVTKIRVTWPDYWQRYKVLGIQEIKGGKTDERENIEDRRDNKNRRKNR